MREVALALLGAGSVFVVAATGALAVSMLVLGAEFANELSFAFESVQVTMS
jgi:hypothetical protein